MSTEASQGIEKSPDFAFDPEKIDRPSPVLLKYYLIQSLILGPLFWAVFIPYYIRYQTLRYRFDENGVAMSWGYFFRREIYLTYRRIQDIHVSTGILQRWLGLATLSVQTASGSSAPEMSIEGILEADQLRDYLYVKMRGARGLDSPTSQAKMSAATLTSDYLEGDAALSLLREIRDQLKSLTERLEKLESSSMTESGSNAIPPGSQS